MSDQRNPEQIKDQIDNLNSHLIMIKSLKESDAQIQYFNLLEKAKNILGDLNPHMGKFYYEYGSFLLNKVQNSMDLFNPNAVPDAQGDDDIVEYDSAYEDQDQIQQGGANLQKIQKKQQNEQKKQDKQQKVVFEDDNIQITQNDNEKLQQKISKKEEQDGTEKADNEEDFSDLEIAYENLQVSLKIFLNQRRRLQDGEDSVLSKEEIFRYVLALHSRIGELYMLDERFEDSIDEYNAVIKLTKQSDKPQLRRSASEAHYNIGNCYLHLNKQNSEIQAIKEYISAHQELLKFIEEKQNFDISKIQVPTMEKFRVDRFGYLYQPFDSELVKDIKDVMSLLLDKIEDTALQIETRPNFQREKAKMNQMRENSGFKEVSKDVKVMNLGTFGNRKRAEPPSTTSQSEKIGSCELGKRSERKNPEIQENKDDKEKEI